MTAQEFNRAYATELAHQRRLVDDMNMFHHRDGRFIEDYSMTDRRTGERLDRGQAFDAHALALLVCWEVEMRS